LQNARNRLPPAVRTTGHAAIFISAFFAAAASAQITNLPPASPGRPAIIAVATEQPPHIDGNLDEPCWQNAPVLSRFTQVLPLEGAAPSERTEARFVYTRDHLFVAVRCFDSAPRSIIAKQMRRDSDFESDDFVTIAFDTFHRQRDGYYFAVNALGARTDGLIQNFSDQQDDWDALWDAGARIDHSGWTVELAIPFKSLSFDPRREVWGCNLERVIRRKQEIVRWTALSRSKEATALSDFGELRGLAELRQGVGLEFRPFVSLKYINEGGGPDWEFKPGADVTYRITPSLTANATFNTDFAEAEVDERIVNLTRFEVSFPEKRDFFLQDSSLFNFGGLYHSPNPYYSRRIGLGADGRPVDIWAGGRLTGRVGDTSIALLDVQQADYANVPSKNLFVGRVSTRVFEESNLGIIATHGDPRRAGDNTLLGMDFNFLNSELWNGKRLVGHTWLMGTDSGGSEGQDAAFGGAWTYPNEPFFAEVQAFQIGEEFDPALGFVSRRGIRDYNGMAEYVFRPNTEWLRSLSVFTRWEYLTDLHNRIIGENNDPLTIILRSPAGDAFDVGAGWDRDVLDEPFEIQPGIVIPAGDYVDPHIITEIETSEARPLSARFEYRFGEYYTGHKQDYEAGLDWRPSHFVTIGVDYELEQVRLAEGSFDVHVVSSRLNVGFTPDLTWQTLVQYDNLSDNLGLNSRVRWTWKPGNDLFFVINQGWIFNDWRLRHVQTEVALKVGATFRF